ncbi:hypothetical protein DM01DRAFT_1332191, partial [Hesseltinella vesiculosa]
MRPSLTKISPTRCFFRCNQPLTSLAQARQVFRSLQQYGDLIEYKFMRCPESTALLRFGFVVFKHQNDAKHAINEQFIKIESPLFKKPLEVKLEGSDAHPTTGRSEPKPKRSDSHPKTKRSHQSNNRA